MKHLEIKINLQNISKQNTMETEINTGFEAKSINHKTWFQLTRLKLSKTTMPKYNFYQKKREIDIRGALVAPLVKGPTLDFSQVMNSGL